MKSFKFILAVICILPFADSFAQTTDHLKLSNVTPVAGEKISLTYDLVGSPLAGKEKPTAVIYFLDNKLYPAVDLDLKVNGKLLNADFTIPDATMAFFVKFSTADLVDDNNGKGYIYLVYDQDKKPVAGAYASKAFLLHSGMGAYLAKIKTDNIAPLELYSKEFQLYPKSEKEFAANYLMFLSRSKDEKVQQLLNDRLTVLAKSGNEKDMLLAANTYLRMQNKVKADSLNAVITAKFPDGDMTRNNMGTAFNKEKDPAKKETLYAVYLAKYPEKDEKNSIQDNFRAQLATAYLQANDMAGYKKWEAQLKNKVTLANSLNNVAYEWAKKGEHLAEAEMLSKQSLDFLDADLKTAGGSNYTSPAQAKKNNRESYFNDADTYALILYKEGKFAEALKYQQQVYDQTKYQDAEINEHYALILAANKQYAKAQEVIEKSIKAGQSSEILQKELAQDYIKVKGSDKGYAEYLAAMNNALKDKMQADIAKQMISKPAPAFTLKDMNGNLVSLASLKGKTVIVDFWATWCGPCKASFPGMQMAVNKYKDDPNVKFLFVDTWENGDNYLPGVKKFIADKKYTFNVLIDEKGDDGRQSKVVSSYGVDGIPTKFIIDKTGNIRFKFVGYSGSPEKLVEEITTMVDMLNSSNAVSNATKVTMN